MPSLPPFLRRPFLPLAPAAVLAAAMAAALAAAMAAPAQGQAPGNAAPASGTAASPSRPPSAEAPKYWVFLHDRARTSGTLSSSKTAPRAARRRALRGDSSASALTRPLPASALAGLRKAGVEPIVRSRWLNAVSARLRPAERRRVRRLPFVDRLEPVAVRTTPAAGPTPPAGRSLSGLLPEPSEAAAGFARLSRQAPPPEGCARAPEAQLRLINALAPLRRGVNGSGVRIGFMDTRYRRLRHEAFDAMRREGRIVGLRDFTEGPQTNNHGAAVVSVAAGHRTGVFTSPAHGAEVLGATTEYTPFERRVEEDFFVAGLEWLERRGADVVNVSIGYTRFDSTETSYTTDDLDGDTAVTTRAVDAAARLGVAVVVSAGNSGCGDPSNCWYYVSTPADADSAITVGAVAADSSVALFSSRGPTADGRTKPDVAAAGRGVCAAWGPAGYRSVNGTSFASPLVAGVVAQMLQVAPGLSPIEVRRLLRKTASQPDRPAPTVGWGVVNAEAAVRAAEQRARATPPSAVTVRPPYPNPARERVWFPVRAPSGSGAMQISVYDVLGRRRIAARRGLRPGPNRISIDVSDLPAGVYLYRLQGDAFADTGRLTVLR